MRATVDQDTCIGCELCPTICPEVFEMRGDKAYAIVSEVPEDTEDSAREAADSCPVDAITVEEPAWTREE